MANRGVPGTRDYPAGRSVKRILVIGGETRSLVRFRGRLLEELGAEGFEVHTAAGSHDAVAERALAGLGVQHHRFQLQRAGRNPLRDLRTLVDLYRLIRAVRPSRVVAYTAKPVGLGLLAARLAGVPGRIALITGLGNMYRDGKPVGLAGFALDAIYRIALRNTDAIIFQNRDDMDTFSRRGLSSRSRRVGVVAGSGIDTTEYPREALPDGAPVFLMMARLVRDKGVLEYCEAARLVRAGRPDARFVLAGGFDENPRSLRPDDLEPFFTDGSVEYVGRVDDVRPLLRSCHIFVLPSAYGEGVPRTLLEALSTGRPVITTDSPGCRDTVVANNGWLVPPACATSLADSIQTALASAGDWPAAAAASRELAESVFDVELVNQTMKGFILEGTA